jgi:hypothetical protein
MVFIDFTCSRYCFRGKRRRRARSATGFAPAGLWFGRRIPRQLPIIFRILHGATSEALEAGAFFSGGQDIGVPTAIAFFGLDPSIRKRQTSLSELPTTLTVLRRRWCGHVPMWDDPAWCVAAIRRTMGTRLP